MKHYLPFSGRFALLAAFLSLPVMAALDTEDEALKLRPVLSPAGIQRIYDNIKTVETNIRDTQHNIGACDKNRAVVIAELKELDKLEEEQIVLTKTYEAYIENGKQRLAKNSEGAEELSKFEGENREKLKEYQGKAQTDLAAKLNTARLEKESREQWKADAEAKMARVNKLIQSGKQNLKDIQARRIPLRGQVSGWVEKQNEFKKLLVELTSRKKELERVAAAKTKELPVSQEN